MQIIPPRISSTGARMFLTTLISSQQILLRSQPIGIFPIREYPEPILPYPLLPKCIPNGVITDSLANFLTGQTYFLRGVYYYYLACTFGGVPLELNVSTNGLASKEYAGFRIHAGSF